MRTFAHVRPLVAHIVRIPKRRMSFPFSIGPLTGCLGSTGKRERQFFRTKDDGRAKACHHQEEAAQGRREEPSLISDALRIEAIECSESLKPLNVSLRVAVDFYIAHHKAAAQSCTVESAVTEYLKNQELKPAKRATYRRPKLPAWRFQRGIRHPLVRDALQFTRS